MTTKIFYHQSREQLEHDMQAFCSQAHHAVIMPDIVEVNGCFLGMVAYEQDLNEWVAFPRETLDEILQEIKEHQADENKFHEIIIDYDPESDTYCASGYFEEVYDEAE